MPVTIAAIFIFLTGIIFSYGSFVAFQSEQLKTLAMVGIPLVHLFTGFGLLRWKSWARPFVIYLSMFYMTLGFFVLQEELLLIDYIPFVSFVRYIPHFVLSLPSLPFILLFLFLIPIVLIVIFSSKKVAVQYEPSLIGKHSWNAPILIVFAAGFIFSFAFLNASKTTFFMVPEGRIFFGHHFNALQSLIVRYVEFYFPLVLAIGLIHGGKLLFATSLAWALYCGFSFWPVHSSPGSSISLLNVSYCTGWFLTASIILSFVHFFRVPALWLEIRKENKLHRLLLILLCSIAIVGISGFHIWQNMKISKTKVAQAKKPKVGLNFGGSSIDPNGSYAIINDEIVQVGFVVQGYRVDKVQSDHVILSKEGKTYRIDSKGALKEI